MRRLLLLPLLVLTGAVPPERPPNILFVLTDDLSRFEADSMPAVQSLAAAGARFSSYFVSVSLCCPSRATMLTGEYAHNTGVKTNGPPDGGFGAAYATDLERRMAGARLQAAGYRTALIGKYLNGYPQPAPIRYVPPGWDLWASANAGAPYAEYNYTLNQNGREIEYGTADHDYGTDVYVELARGFLRQASAERRPFFVYLSLYAPHEPAVPARRHEHRFARATAPRTPGYDEADVGDKPAWVARLRRFSPRVRDAVDSLARLRLRSVQAVDEGLQALVDELDRLGELDRTYIFFASDNGFHLGQHRMPAGKNAPYDEDIRVPLMVRGPGVRPGSIIRALAGNVDLAPTWLELAGLPPAAEMDGRSLLPLLRGRSPAWRRAYLLEHWRREKPAQPLDNPRPGMVDSLADEPADMDQGNERLRRLHPGPRAGWLDNVAQVPPYSGLRSSRYLYVEYHDGERELYDLEDDPNELVNLAGAADPRLLDSLALILEGLRRCRGAACRRLEER